MALRDDDGDDDDGGGDAAARRLAAAVRDKRREVAEAQQRLARLRAELRAQERRLADRERAAARRADAAADWLRPRPWDARLHDARARVFGVAALRPLQHEALNATLLRRDVFAVLPTGAGKSLLYQLAAVVDGGLTLVVSPLISLSMDQRAALAARGIRAECLHAELAKSAQAAIYDAFLPRSAFAATSAHPRKPPAPADHWVPDDVPPMVLFVTPEQVVRSKKLLSRLELLHENGHLSRICVDEAHCCSSWGHDFRPEYRKLAILRRQCPSTPIIALTATCSPATVDDVCSVLEMPRAVTFRSGVNRPNLFYQVRPKPDNDAAVIAQIASWLSTEFEAQCGIIYVLSRKDAEKYAAGLAQHAIDAACYHADMPISHRTEVHQLWSSAQVPVVVATIAFGLGIDHPHVRFIIHVTMASSIEAYYQESGRAGRDGLPAKCIVLHRPKDFARMSAFVGDKGPIRLQKMYDMYAYACSRGLGTGALCRRELIVRSFGEQLPARRAQQCESCCDLCDARLGRVDCALRCVDVSDVARGMLAMVGEFVQRHPTRKSTILQFANDWGRASRAAAHKAKRGEKAMMGGALDVNLRVEIIIELVLSGALKEYHRHSSYAVNAYVTVGNVDGAMNKQTIEVAVWKKGDIAGFVSTAKRRRNEGTTVNAVRADEDRGEVIVIEESDEERAGDCGQEAPKQNRLVNNSKAPTMSAGAEFVSDSAEQTQKCSCEQSCAGEGEEMTAVKRRAKKQRKALV